jgi:pimeloyl-ACP methyl ester carboxylesterase
MASAKTLNVLLVHGGFVDGSGWQGVSRILKRDGYSVTVVQNPTSSLADDVAATHRVLAALDGPAVRGGHSYGGAWLAGRGTGAEMASLHGTDPGRPANDGAGQGDTTTRIRSTTYAIGNGQLQSILRHADELSGSLRPLGAQAAVEILKTLALHLTSLRARAAETPGEVPSVSERVRAPCDEIGGQALALAEARAAGQSRPEG